MRYGSACSGIDAFAAAVKRVRTLEYVHAAERDARAIDVLLAAHGPSTIYHNAGGISAAEAPPVDLYVLTPDCVAFSRRRHDRDAAVVAGGALEVHAVLGFVRAKRARVVVLENVDEADGVGAIDTTLSAIAGYEWHSQRLCPHEHFGEPVRRARRFWVGVREE